MMIRLVLVPVLCATFALAQRYNDNYYQTTERPRIYHPPAKVHYASVGDKLSGDYKFGYDTGKGPAGQSFREEVRLADGTVKGSYGYLDDQGQQRLVKYTAGAQGFVLDSDTPAGQNQAPAPQPRPQPAYRAPEPAPLPQYREPPAQQYRAARTQEYRRPRTQEYQPAPQEYEPAPREYRRPRTQEYQPAPQQYQAPAQQYQAPAQTYTNPTRNPAYNPHHAAYYASIGKQYVPPRARSQEERRREEESYGPPVIPYDLLSYNIGTAQG